jgi:hypothetical protein
LFQALPDQTGPNGAAYDLFHLLLNGSEIPALLFIVLYIRLIKEACVGFQIDFPGWIDLRHIESGLQLLR